MKNLQIVFLAAMACQAFSLDSISGQERKPYFIANDGMPAFHCEGYIFPNWEKIIFDEYRSLENKGSCATGMTLKEFAPIYDAIRVFSDSGLKQRDFILQQRLQAKTAEEKDFWRIEGNKLSAVDSVQKLQELCKSQLVQNISPDKLEAFKNAGIGSILERATLEELLEGAEVLEGFKLSESELAAVNKEIKVARLEYEREAAKLRQKMYKRVMASIPPDELEKLERYMMIDLKPQNEKKD